MASNAESTDLKGSAQRCMRIATTTVHAHSWSLLQFVALTLAASALMGTASAQEASAAVTKVATPQDLVLAIGRGDTHVHIIRHLDLTEVPANSTDDNALFEPGKTLESLTVRTQPGAFCPTKHRTNSRLCMVNQ